MIPALCGAGAVSNRASNGPICSFSASISSYPVPVGSIATTVVSRRRERPAARCFARAVFPPGQTHFGSLFIAGSPVITWPAPSTIQTGATRSCAEPVSCTSSSSSALGAFTIWAPWSIVNPATRRVATRPPTPRLFSTIVTRCPARVRARPAARPATPAPTIPI